MVYGTWEHPYGIKSYLSLKFGKVIKAYIHWDKRRCGIRIFPTIDVSTEILSEAPRMVDRRY